MHDVPDSIPQLPGYELEVPLAAGGSGRVFRARRTVDGTAVAVKLLRGPDGLDRARHEAAALRAVDHPGVLRAHEVVVAGGGGALVTDLIADGSLADRLASDGPLPPVEAVRVVAAVADAVQAVHDAGLVHGDLKPANVLLGVDGPLLADLGSARPLADGAGRAGAGDTGRGADLEALARLGHAALTGAATEGPLSPVTATAPQVPAAIAVAVDDALSPDRSLRPRSAARFAAELRRSAAPAPAPGPVTRDFGPRPPRPAAVPARRRPVPSVAVVLAAVVGLALLLSPVSPVGADGAQPTEVTLAVRPAPERPCPPAPSRPAGAEVMRGDVTGDGCVDAAWWWPDDGVLEVPVGPHAGRYALGRPGDQAVLGDWDCDGHATPALYRPATGEVFTFTGWADDRPLTSRPPVPDHPRGTASVTSGDEGCDRLVVRSPASTP